ncbi:MAG: ABC transporter substrate-binding protein [Hyphomicrobiales bacterium]|nr:ABC transporter substrate-binding protein [Hyphomicrobiales bacterium]
MRPLKRTTAIALGVFAFSAAPALAIDCPIKLGGIAPLSAPGSVTGGEAQRDAMRIAVEEINAAGGVLGCQVELVVGDTEGLPEKGTALFEKLIGQDNVAAIGGGYHSSVGIAAKEVAHDKGVPVVFASTWNDQITASKLPEVFRVAPLSSEASAIYWKFAAGVPGTEKVVIVTENTDYGIPAAEETQKGLESAGLAATTFAVDIGTQDFSGIVQRVKAENPNVIIVLLTGEASLNFEQQAAENGIGPGDLPFVCDIIAAESASYWQNVPDGNYCFVGQFGLPEALYNDAAKAFAAKYKERTGKEAVESYAIEAFDSIGVLAAAIEKAGSTEGKDIIAALETIEHDGALGKVSFPYGQGNDTGAAGVEDKFWHQYLDPALMIFQYQEEGQKAGNAPIVFPDTYKTGEPQYVNQ